MKQLDSTHLIAVADVKAQFNVLAADIMGIASDLGDARREQKAVLFKLNTCSMRLQTLRRTAAYLVITEQ
jgi:hypothetical protein